MIRCRFHLLFLLLLSPGLQASDSDTISVCYEAWEPYIFVNDQGQISGIDYDLLSAAAKYLGYTVTYNKQPYKRCLAEARAGRADIVLSISKGKPGTLQSSVVSAYWILAAIVPANSPLETPVSLENLRGKRVLLIDGYIYPPKLRQWFADNSHIIYANYGADDSSLIPFRMLEFKRADVFIEDLPWSRKFISDNDLKLRVLAPPLAIVPNYMGFRKGRAELRDQIDDFLARQGQGFRDELFLKYSGQPEATFSGN